MMNANVKLSQSELQLVCDEQFILTKNNIINKVYLLFGTLSDVFLQQTNTDQNFFPDEVLKASPKIYRGENYRGLPYVMLDYPRYFVKDDAFSVRCLFWWGNFFSFTLHLSGKYAKHYAEPIFQKLLKENNSWYVCINEDQWQHHFNADNYSLPDKKLLMHLHERKFQKIAKKISLKQWNEAFDFFVKSYEEVIELLKIK
jgi:hypothetical protein